MFPRIVLDFARRHRFVLALLGGFYCVIAVTGTFESSYGQWVKLSLFLAYSFASCLGPIFAQFDCLRGWLRAVRQLPVNSAGAVSLSLWSICVGIPTAWVLLLTLPTAVFWSPDQFDQWFSLILATSSIVFASASVFFLTLTPTGRTGRLGGQRMPGAVFSLLGLAIWLSGFFLYFRWAGGARSAMDFPSLPVLMAGVIFSVAGLLRLRSTLFGTAKVTSVFQRLGREPVKQWRDEFKSGLTGWAHLTAGWIVRQVGLALGAVVLYVLFGAALHYYRLGEIAELPSFESATPAYSLSLLLAATLLVLGYGATAIEISSARLFRTLPCGSIHGGLRLICSAFAAILCLLTPVGLALLVIENTNDAVGWLFSLVGAAGPASLAIPCALYLRDTVVSVGPSILVWAATVAWMHIAPLMDLLTLGIVAPAVCLGGNLLSLLLVIGIFSRSSSAYRDQGSLIQSGLGN